MFFCYDIFTVKIMSRGPALSGFNPSKEKYRCPVQNCNADLNKSAAVETIEKKD
jgi:hypothetical protein